VGDFFLHTDPIELTIENLQRFANVNLSAVDLRCILNTPKNRQLIYESITHKSIDETYNYEKLELFGDRIFEFAVGKFFHSFPTRNVNLLANFRNFFTSGEIQTRMFLPMLRLDEIIIANDDECIKKVGEDVVEAYIAALYLIFEDIFTCFTCNALLVTEEMYVEHRKTCLASVQTRSFSERLTCGADVCANIIRRILGPLNFDEYIHLINPPKTVLKELLAAYRIPMESCYKTTRGNEWEVQDYTVTLKIDQWKFYQKYVGTGRPRDVERLACSSFLVALYSIGKIPKGGVRHLKF
jgi:hypothetical protein